MTTKKLFAELKKKGYEVQKVKDGVYQVFKGDAILTLNGKHWLNEAQITRFYYEK